MENRFKIILLLIHNLFLTTFVCFSQDIILNEVVAKNASCYKSSKDETPDWVELKNISPNLISLSGYSLVRKSKPAEVYTIPSKNILSEKVLLIELQDFPLSASGETLYLKKKEDIIDSISWENLPVDVSVGRARDDNYSVYYFKTPTPKKINNTETFVAKTLPKPKANKSSQFFVKKFYVNVYCSDEKATLRYTLDGSEPTQSSNVYTDSLQITKNTNLRVRAFRSGYLPSETMTITYLKLRSSSLPIASITVKYEDFFDELTGIYVEGPNAENDEPHFGANYWNDWERPVHFEYFTEDGACVLSQDVGVKIGGNWSRAQPQKTLKLFARDIYGKDEMKYKFFKDKPISSFHEILLRNSGNDCNQSHIRDGVASELAKEMDIDRQAYQPAVVYINGEYFGIQNVREKQNEHYIAENYGYLKEDIDIIKNGYEVYNGKSEDYWSMRNFIENSDLSIPENYEFAKTLLDIPSFIDYNIIEMYVVNEDWPGNNIACWHSRSKNTPWRYLLFDTDFGFGIWKLEEKLNQNMFEWCTRENSGDYATANWATVVLRQLLKNNDFRRDFLNAVADRLNTTLSRKNVPNVVDSVYNLISEEMPFHRQRWGSSWNDREFDRMREFGERRESIMRKQAEEFFSTNGSYQLSLNVKVESTEAFDDAVPGRIHLNTIDVSNFPWKGSYFKNNKICLTAIPNLGYEFIRWEGSVNTSEKSIYVDTEDATSLTAVFSYVGNEPSVVFTECYYHVSQEDETEWIELYSDQNKFLNLTNWTLILDCNNQKFVFPENSSIGADEKVFSLIVANNKERFCAKYPDISPEYVVGDLGFVFPKDFGYVTLKDANDNTISKMDYSDEFPYVRKADGYGYSCELMYDYYTLGFDSEKSWYAPTKGGTPLVVRQNIPETGFRPPIITELNYASGTKYDPGDWIEIYNPNESIDLVLDDWMLMDKSENIFILSGELPSKEFVVYAKNPEKFHSVFPEISCRQLNISLNKFEDAVMLFNPYEFKVDEVSYSMFEKQWTKSAFGTGRTLSLVDLDADNSKGENWRASMGIGTPGSQNDFVDNITQVENSNVVLYPNPCSDYVVIQAVGEFSYEVISEAGVVVCTGKGLDSKFVSMKSFSPGVYVIIVSTQNGGSVKMLLEKGL
ncbi:MAG: CotH kinase family protein [Bacteroidales bacterium]|nr:CotH kinase family protein [Bacteroidales bacterium]